MDRHPVRRLRIHLVFALFGLLALACLTQPATACTHSTPPPPFCGKTLVVSAAVPGTLLLSGGGGSFNVSVLVFFNLVDFPPGSGVCPGGPYSVTIDITATCTGGGDGGGTNSVTITPGFNTVTVPVTLDPGAPRLCDLDVSATVSLSDGMVITNSSDTVVCVADPAPGNPSLPRLDLQLQGAAGSELSRVHPGDQSMHTYRVTNNDPTESFSGEIAVEMVNTSRMPGATGPMPPGTGPFSVSDPVEGDNFPIGSTDDLFEGCLQLPQNPTDPAIPIEIVQLDLAAGASIDLDFFARPWGMCANGSCGRAKVTAQGDFSDVSPGLACAGFVTAADTSVPPTYAWPDAGETAQVETPPAPNTTTLAGESLPGFGFMVDFVTNPLTVLVNGIPTGAPQNAFSDQVTPELGRTQVQVFDPKGPFQVDSFFDIFYDIEVAPSSGQTFETELREMNLIGNSPTGFEDIAPAGMGLVALGQPGAPFVVDSFFDIVYQIEVVGIDELGERRPISFAGRSFTADTDGSGFQVQLEGGQVAPGPGSELLAIELTQDFRGFFSETQQGNLGEIFTDGFESGDVSAWSNSQP